MSSCSEGGRIIQECEYQKTKIMEVTLKSLLHCRVNKSYFTFVEFVVLSCVYVKNIAETLFFGKMVDTT